MRRKEERSKRGQTNNKTKQHNTPKVFTVTLIIYIQYFHSRIDIVISIIMSISYSVALLHYVCICSGHIYACCSKAVWEKYLI